jgi:hypothetical protein
MELLNSLSDDANILTAGTLAPSAKCKPSHAEWRFGRHALARLE